MFHLDNNSGVLVMPNLSVAQSNKPKWFTEGDVKVAASYPGQDWFNIVQAELLNILVEAGIESNKTELNQLATAIKKIINAKIPAATTLEAGIVKLGSDVDKDDETIAATLKAVKKAYDLANGALPITGGTVTGETNFTGGLKVNGSEATSLNDFYLSISGNGYQKLPSGLIIQWGGTSASPNGGKFQPFPITFPVGCFQVVGCVANGITATATFKLGDFSASGFNFACSYNPTSTTTNYSMDYCRYFAIGY